MKINVGSANYFKHIHVLFLLFHWTVNVFVFAFKVLQWGKSIMYHNSMEANMTHTILRRVQNQNKDKKTKTFSIKITQHKVLTPLQWSNLSLWKHKKLWGPRTLLKPPEEVHSIEKPNIIQKNDIVVVSSASLTISNIKVLLHVTQKLRQPPLPPNTQESKRTCRNMHEHASDRRNKNEKRTLYRAQTHKDNSV